MREISPKFSIRNSIDRNSLLKLIKIGDLFKSKFTIITKRTHM